MHVLYIYNRICPWTHWAHNSHILLFNRYSTRLLYIIFNRNHESDNSMDITFTLKVMTRSVITITESDISSVIITVSQQSSFNIDITSVISEGMCINIRIYMPNVLHGASGETAVATLALQFTSVTTSVAS